MARAQFRAVLYWPGAEFIYLVFTTSTGEAITVVQKPAPNADVKWHGRSSVRSDNGYFSGTVLMKFQDLYYSALAYQSSVYFAAEHL